ncbi:hypothetical protein [Nocardia brasiliensis]|uniref:hypothetical protein n=1 Tax=Nocardia brasiliensis TaxID=37326 RepID=UPI0024555CBB|nr:hypothetical protein [Nocardia brasiliensis]
MPDDGYNRDRNGFDSNERGRIFENGTDRYYKDREKGYVRDSRTFEHGNEKIQFDKIKDDRGAISSIEDKSGRIGGPKDVKQLEVVRALLAKGEISQHLLRSVAGESISKPAQEIINELARDFPDRFTHEVIPRHVAREVWARGLAKETGKQLELPGVGERAREQKAKQREEREKRAKAAELARAAAEKLRKVQRFLQGVTRGRAEAPQVVRDRQAQEQAARAKQRESITPETERERVARESAAAVLRDFPFPALDVQTPAREAPDAATVDREAKEREERERQAAKAIEEANRARDAYFQQNQAKMTEVERLAWLQQGASPLAAVLEPPAHTPERQRGDRSQDHSRTRGPERGR